MEKAFLPESLKNNTAEFYLIDNGEFWFYKKENNGVELVVRGKEEDTIFGSPTIMEKIFEFLKNQGYTKIVMSILKGKFSERHSLMLKYGFIEKESVDLEGSVIAYYEKTYN